MNIPIFYPFIHNINTNVDFGKGPWSWGKPSGITIHYSSDRDVSRVINWLQQEKFGYHLLIDREGKVIQTCPFNKCVDHAGKAVWNNLSPNRHHIAICIMSWGKLVQGTDKYYSWTGEEIPFDDVAMRPNFLGKTSAWDKATKKQEATIDDLIRWLVVYGIKPENICGHDESCLPQGRKQDPGGVLSLSTLAIRNTLKLEAAKDGDVTKNPSAMC
jgi:N-acetyl-anhydromuramyl-L-alanine amidase AmpD